MRLGLNLSSHSNPTSMRRFFLSALVTALLCIWLPGATLMGCDALGGECMNECTGNMDRGTCASVNNGGGCVSPWRVRLEVTPHNSTCTSGSPCVRFSFTQSVTGGRPEQNSLVLDRVVIETPGGLRVTRDFSDSTLVPNRTYQLQNPGTAYTRESGSYDIAFIGALPNDARWEYTNTEYVYASN